MSLTGSVNTPLKGIAWTPQQYPGLPLLLLRINELNNKALESGFTSMVGTAIWHCHGRGGGPGGNDRRVREELPKGVI